MYESILGILAIITLTTGLYKLYSCLYWQELREYYQRDGRKHCAVSRHNQGQQRGGASARGRDI